MMATKEKLFLPNHLCVLCGFSFLRQESNSIPVINNAKRLHLTEHRLNNIKSVMAPLDPTIDKEALKNNSVCTNCYKDIESFLKIEEKLTLFKMVLVERRLKVKGMYSTVQSLGVVKQDGKLVVTPSTLTIQQNTGNISFKPAQNLCEQNKGPTAANLISLLAQHIEKKPGNLVPVPSANAGDSTNPGSQTTPSGQLAEPVSLSTEPITQGKTVKPKPPCSTVNLKNPSGKAMHSKVEENISGNTKGEPMDYQITLNQTGMDQNAPGGVTTIITSLTSQNHTGQFIKKSTAPSSNSLIQCNIIRRSDGKILLVPAVNQDNYDKTAQKPTKRFVSLSSQTPSNQKSTGQNSSGTRVFKPPLLPKPTGQIIVIPSPSPLKSRSEELNTCNNGGMSSLRHQTGQVIVSQPQSHCVNQSELLANQQTNNIFAPSPAPQASSKPGQSCSGVGSYKQRRANKMKVARTYLYKTDREDESSITPINQHITDPSPETTINQPLSYTSNNVGGPVMNNSVVMTIKGEVVDLAQPLSVNNEKVSEGSNHCSVIPIKEEIQNDTEAEDNESADTNYELNSLDKDFETPDNQGGEVSIASAGLEGFQTDDNALVCGICNLSFENTQLLLKHMQDHSDDKSFMCQFCEASFETSEILQAHTLTCLVVGRKNYKCHICGNCFPTDANLRHHLKTHAYKCDVCTKPFKCEEDFQKHVNLHKGKRVFTCETCGRNFHLVGGLITHRLIHTGEKNFKCEICGCSFRLLPQLKRHLRVHSEERPFECDVCFKRFKHVSNLTAHAFIHTGLKPHKCDICSKSFRCISSLHKHVLRHTKMKPHKCDICEMRFFGKRELMQHANTHWK